MLVSPLALDLARFEGQQRMQQAARAALAAQLRAAAPRHAGPGQVLRLGLATSLRNLAIRLDPSLDCGPRLAAVSTPR